MWGRTDRTDRTDKTDRTDRTDGAESPIQANDSYLELKITNLYFLSAIQISQLRIIAYLECIAFTIMHYH